MSDISLRITEIFLSLQGEAAFSGYPTVFVRLTGCPLRCVYCDSEYAFFGGQKLSLEKILVTVKNFDVHHVCVTGGEPLAQANCKTLLTDLCDRGSIVSLETSGAMEIAEVDPRVSIVMDLKTPASGEVARNDYGNIAYLKPKDQVKFVISDRKDFDWAVFKVNEYQLCDRVDNVFFSPVFEKLDAVELAAWVIAEKLPVRLQTQLHKNLWGEKPGV